MLLCKLYAFILICKCDDDYVCIIVDYSRLQMRFLTSHFNGPGRAELLGLVCLSLCVRAVIFQLNDFT